MSSTQTRADFFRSLRAVAAANRMNKQSCLRLGSRVEIGHEEFDVGAFVPELDAWDLIQDGHRAMTVRTNVLLALAESVVPPRDAA